MNTCLAGRSDRQTLAERESQVFTAEYPDFAEIEPRRSMQWFGRPRAGVAG